MKLQRIRAAAGNFVAHKCGKGNESKLNIKKNFLTLKRLQGTSQSMTSYKYEELHFHFGTVIFLHQKGQHLEPFIQSYFNSCESPKPKPSRPELTILSPTSENDKKVWLFVFSFIRYFRWNQNALREDTTVFEEVLDLLYNQVHTYWDIDRILIFLTLNTMDLKWNKQYLLELETFPFNLVGLIFASHFLRRWFPTGVLWEIIRRVVEIFQCHLFGWTIIYFL